MCGAGWNRELGFSAAAVLVTKMRNNSSREASRFDSCPHTLWGCYLKSKSKIMKGDPPNRIWFASAQDVATLLDTKPSKQSHRFLLVVEVILCVHSASIRLRVLVVIE